MENPTDRGVWQAIIHRVENSHTQLKRLSMHTCNWTLYASIAPSKLHASLTTSLPGLGMFWAVLTVYCVCVCVCVCVSVRTCIPVPLGEEWQIVSQSSGLKPTCQNAIHYKSTDWKVLFNKCPICLVILLLNKAFFILFTWKFIAFHGENVLIYKIYKYQLLFLVIYLIISVQFSSVAQSCPTLCDPMNCSPPGLPVHLQLPEFT